MKNKFVVFLSAGQIVYIQERLAKQSKPYDWFLIKDLEKQTGKSYASNKF